jgi:rubrerythrin
VILPKVAKPSNVVFVCRHCKYEVGSNWKYLCADVPKQCPACGCPSAPPLNVSSEEKQP